MELIKTSFINQNECKSNKKLSKSNFNNVQTVLPAVLQRNDLNQIQIYSDKEPFGTNIKNKFDEVIDDKLDSDVYSFFYSESILTTTNYLFYKMGVGIYVQIKNNKIHKYIPFNNMNYENDWYNIIQLDKRYKSTREYFNIKNKIYPIRKSLYSLYDKKKWSATDCLIFTEHGKQPQLNDSYWTQLKDIIDETCKNRKIPDIIFFINKKDLPFLKKNRTHPFESIMGTNYPIDIGKYYYFSPILSQTTRNEYADIPIPSSDEWEFITQKYFINSCNNNYIHKKDFVKWEDKINTAFFRGRGTGCSLDIKDNPRLHITKINNEWKNNNNYNENNSIDKISFINAGIIRFSRRSKANNGIMSFQDNKKLEREGVNLVEFVDHKEQKKYKYLVYIEGNSAAYRLPYMLSLNSLVIKVNSKYKLWFEHLLKPYEHYVPVKHDLSDLANSVKWCKQNDKKCKDIMLNANNFCKTYFTKSYIYDYMQNIFIKIANKQFNSDDIYKKFGVYKKKRKIITKVKKLIEWKDVNKNIKSAIIVPFRDNKFQDRKGQLIKFIEYWKNKKIELKDYHFKIFIIEQSQDNRKFNRGQLLNLGQKIAEKEGFNNLIFHDVDLTPSDELLPYYFKLLDAPIHLGSIWNKYNHYTFFGGVTILNNTLFKKINGFPNQFWGWGGEDDVLYNRCANYIDKMIIPTKGTFAEMKHINTSKIKSIKLSSIIKFKLILDDLNNKSKDGVSHLKLSKISSIELEKDLADKIIFELTNK